MGRRTDLCRPPQGKPGGTLAAALFRSLATASGEEVKRLRFIRIAECLGYSLAGIAEILRRLEGGETPRRAGAGKPGTNRIPASDAGQSE